MGNKSSAPDKKGKQDKLGKLAIYIAPVKHIYDPSFMTHRDGSNERSQHVFVKK